MWILLVSYIFQHSAASPLRRPSNLLCSQANVMVKRKPSIFAGFLTVSGHLHSFVPLRTTFSTVQPPKAQQIWPVSEICASGNAKCDHWKFCHDPSTQLGLARLGTNRQTDYCGPSEPLTGVTFARMECFLLNGGSRRMGAIRPYNGGTPPQKTPRYFTVASSAAWRMTIFNTSAPSLHSGAG